MKIKLAIAGLGLVVIGIGAVIRYKNFKYWDNYPIPWDRRTVGE